MSTAASILLISPYPEDHITLGRILSENQWRMRHALSWTEAEPLLQNGPYMAVITESSMDDCSWRDVLKSAGESPVVVSSRTADENLWSEVLSLGGYNVLAKPFDLDDVDWVLRNACGGHTQRVQRMPERKAARVLALSASA